MFGRARNSLRRVTTTCRAGGARTFATATARGARSGFAVAGAAAVAVAAAAVALTPTAQAEAPKPASKADSHQSETSGVRRLKTTGEIKERFEQFASGMQNGARIMTFDDFCRSLSLDATAENSKALFGSADLRGDGGVSLADYAAFVSMLHSSDAELRVAFSLFDLNHDGQISLEEFSKVVNARIAGPDFAFQMDTSLMQRFFGDDGSKKLNLRQFRAVLDTLEKGIVESTFKRFDTAGTGRISGAHVLKYLDQHLAVAVPKHVREHLYARQQSTDVVADGITSDMFWALHCFVRDIDTIETALQTVITNTNGRDTVTRDEFVKAFTTSRGSVIPSIADSDGKESNDGGLAGGGAPDPREVEMIFRIFGNRDGTLDHRQFAAWVKAGKPGELPPMTLLESFALSGMAAMVGATTVFPIDKIKTRLQTSNTPGASMISTAKEIFKKEGGLRMYRGLQAQLVGITPEKALKLTSNQFFVDMIKNGVKRDLSFLENALSGVLTGCVQVSITNPVEIVKIRLQMQKSGGEIKSPLAVVRELGLRGLYTGLPATILRDIPFNAMYFSIYPWLKHQFADKDGGLTSVRVLAASAGAGVFAAALDTPADTIKTRLQAGQTKYTGIVDCIRKTYAEEGAHAFTKGLVPRVLIISPLFGITFMVFEQLQHWLLPLKRVPLENIASDFAAIRRSRVQQIDAQLAIKYGINLNGTKKPAADVPKNAVLPPTPAVPATAAPAAGTAAPAK